MFDVSDRRSPTYWVIVCLLTANTLDLTTSIIPSPADHLWPIPPKATWLLTVQSLLVIPFLWILHGEARRVYSALMRTTIPRGALVTILTFVFIATVHVLLRYESFPFSPVAMFSSGVTPRMEDPVKAEGYVVVSPTGDVLPLGTLLEGNPLFGRYNLDWDYKSGWAMYIYGYVQSRARDEIKAELAQRGYPHVIRTPYVYNRRSGEIIWPKLKPKAP